MFGPWSVEDLTSIIEFSFAAAAPVSTQIGGLAPRLSIFLVIISDKNSNDQSNAVARNSLKMAIRRVLHMRDISFDVVPLRELRDLMAALGDRYQIHCFSENNSASARRIKIQRSTGPGIVMRGHRLP